MHKQNFESFEKLFPYFDITDIVCAEGRFALKVTFVEATKVTMIVA